MDRCVVCGKEFEDGASVQRIVTGLIKNGEFVEAKKAEWGKAHVTCFERSVNSPSMVLERIRKLAKAAK